MMEMVVYLPVGLVIGAVLGGAVGFSYGTARARQLYERVHGPLT
jgi:hypothetical protein